MLLFYSLLKCCSISAVFALCVINLCVLFLISESSAMNRYSCFILFSFILCSSRPRCPSTGRPSPQRSRRSSRMRRRTSRTPTAGRGGNEVNELHILGVRSKKEIITRNLEDFRSGGVEGWYSNSEQRETLYINQKKGNDGPWTYIPSKLSSLCTLLGFNLYKSKTLNPTQSPTLSPYLRTGQVARKKN